MSKIGIIGAGWLGGDIAQRFSVDENNCVRITNRSLKRIEGCQSFCFEFGEILPQEFTQNLDFLFISSVLPKTDTDVFSDFIEQLKTALPKNCTLVFTSTIGVYSSESGTIDETSKKLNDASVYFLFEQLLVENFPKRTIILRLGGLIGDDRHPVTHLSARKDIPNGNHPVNLVHKGDILHFSERILQNAVPASVYNIVYPYHPPKKDYYQEQALKRALTLPEFLPAKTDGKIIDSQKSQAILGFDYGFCI